MQDTVNVLSEIYEDWITNFITVTEFAEAYGLTHQQAFDLITICYDRHTASFKEK